MKETVITYFLDGVETTKEQIDWTRTMTILLKGKEPNTAHISYRDDKGHSTRFKEAEKYPNGLWPQLELREVDGIFSISSATNQAENKKPSFVYENVLDEWLMKFYTNNLDLCESIENLEGKLKDVKKGLSTRAKAADICPNGIIGFTKEGVKELKNRLDKIEKEETDIRSFTYLVPPKAGQITKAKEDKFNISAGSFMIPETQGDYECKLREAFKNLQDLQTENIDRQVEDWLKETKSVQQIDGDIWGIQTEKGTVATPYLKTSGVKETEGKLDYELDWNFLTQMAERMSTNKGKYPPYNWHKKMDVEKLKQAMFRHVLEVMNGNYEDDERLFGHIEAISCNAMLINYQLKNNK